MIRPGLVRDFVIMVTVYQIHKNNIARTCTPSMYVYVHPSSNNYIVNI